jgi:hypothetical protein
LAYLKHSPNRGLCYTKNCLHPKGELIAAVDSDWAGDKAERHSTAGGLVWFMGSPVSWFSLKEKVIALSSCEAEYIALSLLVRDVIHLRLVLSELGFTQLKPTVIFIDSKSAFDLAHDAKFRKRSKHIDIQYHYVREAIAHGYITLRWLKGTANPADLLTKDVTHKIYKFHLNEIMWDLDQRPGVQEEGHTLSPETPWYSEATEHADSWALDSSTPTKRKRETFLEQ